MLGRLFVPALIASALLAGCAARDDPDDGARGADDAAPPPASPSAPAPASLPAPSLAVPSPRPAPAPSAPAPAEPTPELPAGPLELTVPILAQAFPARIEAPVGSTISWSNLDDGYHSVLSDDGTFSGSGPLGPGMEFARTFLVAGEYAFHCGYHESMTGVLVIR